MDSLLAILVCCSFEARSGCSGFSRPRFLFALRNGSASLSLLARSFSLR